MISLSFIYRVKARGFIYLSQGVTYIGDHSRIVLSIFLGRRSSFLRENFSGTLHLPFFLKDFSSESIVILVFRFNFKFPVRLL